MADQYMYNLMIYLKEKSIASGVQHSLSHLVQSNRPVGTNSCLTAVVFPQAKDHEDGFLDTILQREGNFS